MRIPRARLELCVWKSAGVMTGVESSMDIPALDEDWNGPESCTIIPAPVYAVSAVYGLSVV